MTPSNDITGMKDTHLLLEELTLTKRVILEPGDYYYTKMNPTPSSLFMVPIEQDGVTIDGLDWNHTTLHMVGTETSEWADWYLFYVGNGRKGFTLKNVTTDGSLMDTIAEQTHGVVAINPVNMLLENVRGQYIFGDTCKMAGTVDNVRFLNTEHLWNGRSGIAIRSWPDSGRTDGGLTIDGFLSIGVLDQAIDFEPGFEPGEVVLANGKVYQRPDQPGGLCMSLIGDGSNQGVGLTMTNWQVYGRSNLYSLSDAIFTNCVFDSRAFPGATIDIRKDCRNVTFSDCIVKGRGEEGVISLSVQSSGRPNRVRFNNLSLHVDNEADNTGIGINVYDCQNIDINNVAFSSNNKLIAAVNYRNVTGDIDRGYFAVTNSKMGNVKWGVRVINTTPTLSMIDTLAVQGCHFRDAEIAILIENPEPDNGAYIRDWDFSGNVYGENVAQQVAMGSVFSSEPQPVTAVRSSNKKVGVGG